MELHELSTVKRQLDTLHDNHLAALSHFVFPSDHGFSRILKEDRKAISEVSTATAVLSIVRAHDWSDEWLTLVETSPAWQKAERDNQPFAQDAMSAQNVMERLLRDDAWTSDSLSDGDRNPYHVAFTTEAALALHEALTQGQETAASLQVHKTFKEAADYLIESLLVKSPEELENGESAQAHPPMAARILVDSDSGVELSDVLEKHDAVARVQRLDGEHIKVHLVAGSDQTGFAFELPKLLVAAKSALMGMTWVDESHQVSQVKGSISIQFPPSAHLTQVAVRTLLQLDNHLALTEDVEPGTFVDRFREPVKNWAWSQILSQLALVQAQSSDADAYELAYALWCYSAFGIDDLDPDEKQVVSAGLDQVFTMQRDDWLWPRSHPIFHHKNIGAAYSYEFEMLSELLRLPELQPHLIRNLQRLTKALGTLPGSAYRVEGAECWSSGHIPQQRRPESWATAAVYLYAYDLDRLLAEAIRRRLFDHVGAEYRTPSDFARPEPGDDRPPQAAVFDLLDSNLPGTDPPRSLLETVYTGIVEPIKDSTQEVARGREIAGEAPVSVLLFGPPGTAKSDIAEKLGPAIGWPVVKVDPSHLVSGGIDKIQTEANVVFELIALSEGVVVFFDEFDELMRSRSSTSTEMVSRFLTTAMLPKLVDIRKRRRVLFVVATNHLDDLDPAIRRVGRFDLVLPVLAPSQAAKTEKWRKTIGSAYDMFKDRPEADMLDLLNYGETKALARILEGLGTRDAWDHDQIQDLLKAEWKASSAYPYLKDKAKKDEYSDYADAGDDPGKMLELLLGPLCEGRRLPEG